MKNKIKKIVMFFLNPRLLLCFGIAWIFTNGWSYVFFALGIWFGIDWLKIVGGAYLTFLWLPISPEKIVTVIISIILLRFFFPSDEKTLAVLKKMYKKLVEKKNTTKQKIFKKQIKDTK